MIYLKEFATQAAYNAAKDGLLTPNVSYIVDGTKVEYNKEQPIPPAPTPDYNGHAYVDLGLPSGTKWATMNVGASSETSYGNYYMYGLGPKVYDWYDEAYEGTEDPLALSADTASQTWGGTWHMPTSAQCEELTANTTYEWVTINGVNCGKFIGENGNYILIPAGGYKENTLKSLGECGQYWTSNPNGDIFANWFYFDESGYNEVEFNLRTFGYLVRPVSI